MKRVSIVVLNYNYARYVGRAIDSALAQTAEGVEVVVVDNGSTDHSLQVIEPYLPRVRLVRQPVNIGQGQGYNLGFEAAQGEWLIWLDADDELDPDCVATCLAMADDSTSKVQYPMRHIDPEGRDLQSMTPYLRHSGDVRGLIRRFGHYAGPPGSGNFYRRSAVAPYFPVPTDKWPIGTDTVPFLTAAFHGKVVDTGRPLASYRLHLSVVSEAPGYKGNYRTSVGGEIRLCCASRDNTLALLRERSGIVVEGPFLMLPTYVRRRIVSWRWAPEDHPCEQDTAASLWRLMRDALRDCPGYTASGRALMLGWATAVLFLPPRLANPLLAANTAQPLWHLLSQWARRRTA